MSLTLSSFGQAVYLLTYNIHYGGESVYTSSDMSIRSDSSVGTHSAHGMIVLLMHCGTHCR